MAEIVEGRAVENRGVVSMFDASALRAANSWGEVRRLVEAWAGTIFRGFAAYVETGAVIAQVGEMRGEMRHAQCDGVTGVGFCGVWDSERAQALADLTTELHKARERLGSIEMTSEESRWRQILAAVLQNAGSMVAVIDSQKRYAFVNEAIAAMHGMAAEAHVGRPMREVVGELADGIAEVVDEVFVSREPIGPVWFTAAFPGRPVRSYRAWYSPVVVDEEVRYVAAVVDELRLTDDSAAFDFVTALDALRMKLPSSDVELVDELRIALERRGLLGESCTAFDVVLQRAALERRTGQVRGVLRWRLGDHSRRVAVGPDVLSTVFASALRAVDVEDSVIEVRAHLTGRELVLVVRGATHAARGLKIDGTEALVTCGGEVRVDGDVVMHLPVL